MHEFECLCDVEQLLSDVNLLKHSAPHLFPVPLVGVLEGAPVAELILDVAHIPIILIPGREVPIATANTNTLISGRGTMDNFIAHINKHLNTVEKQITHSNKNKRQGHKKTDFVRVNQACIQAAKINSSN